MKKLLHKTVWILHLNFCKLLHIQWPGFRCKGWPFTSEGTAWLKTPLMTRVQYVLIGRLPSFRRRTQVKAMEKQRVTLASSCDRIQLQVSFSIALRHVLSYSPYGLYHGDQPCGCIPEPSSQIRLSGGSRSDAPFIGRQRHKPCLLDHGWDPASDSKTAVPVFTLIGSCNLRNSRFVKLQQVCSKHSLAYLLSAVDCAVGVQHTP